MTGGSHAGMVVRRNNKTHDAATARQHTVDISCSSSSSRYTSTTLLYSY